MSARKNYTVRLNAAEAATIKTEADRAGVSVGEHIRRLALNRAGPTTQASVGALDTSALDAVAQRLGEQINDLARIGSGLRKIEDRMARGQAVPIAAKQA